MSEEKDSVDEAWDDVPDAEPTPVEPAKAGASTSKPPSEPPKPASTPPRPSSSSPPRPASNSPGAPGTGGSGKRTLIGIPAPVVAEKATDKPADRTSDKPSDAPRDKAPELTSSRAPTLDAIPAAKRTLIGITSPVIAQKATLSVDQKATPPEPWKASQAPKAISSPPAESLPETRRDEPSLPPPPPAEEPSVPRTKRALSQTTRKETPDALAAAKAQARSSRGRISSAPPEAEKSSRLGPILLVAILGAAAIWFVLSKQRSMSEPVIETVPAPVPLAEQPQPEKPPEPVPPPEPVAAPAPEPAAAPASEPVVHAEPSAAPPTSAAEAEKAPKAAPEKPAASAEPAPAVDPASASAEGVRVVTVHLTPPDARLFYKGKSVGKTPVRVELAPGEKKRSFEVGRPGFVTRRLIVDGSEAVIWIGLRPEAAAPAPTE